MPLSALHALPVLAASYDIDWNGDGCFTFETPQTCPDCELTLRVARARPHLSGTWTATCPHCLATLGRVDPGHRCAGCGVELFEADRLCVRCEFKVTDGDPHRA